ncbi:VOC family protein [Agrococcus jejuensis]|uniref:Glyoxalase/Bleomycin resistance protein/Dioxygenase superfamily protein n=1 Tax=Agrococcus jejuensis TaxID=399736 RepID=A0A1G8FTZ6_9MICO|nr:VOC family protein [Agrococcus jejuensis]SDH85592.1 Glyoxalase/Bleomycin resistance protein/Dioxygenase superfamily protein [Agrococcus jejuensis]
MPTIDGVHHVAITVRDLDASVAFYERLLGAPPVASLAGEGLLRRLFALPGGTNLGLTQHETRADGDFSPFRPGLDHLGLGVASRDDLEAWVEHLDAVGIAHDGIVDVEYGSALSLKDPDGVALELFVGA